MFTSIPNLSTALNIKKISAVSKILRFLKNWAFLIFFRQTILRIGLTKARNMRHTPKKKRTFDMQSPQYRQSPNLNDQLWKKSTNY